MFTLSCCQQVDLTTSGIKRARVLAANAKQEQLRYVAKVEPDAAAIRSAVFANLVPHEIDLVVEIPKRAGRLSRREAEHLDTRDTGDTYQSRPAQPAGS